MPLELGSQKFFDLVKTLKIFHMFIKTSMVIYL